MDLSSESNSIPRLGCELSAAKQRVNDARQNTAASSSTRRNNVGMETRLQNDDSRLVVYRRLPDRRSRGLLRSIFCGTRNMDLGVCIQVREYVDRCRHESSCQVNLSPSAPHGLE